MAKRVDASVYERCLLWYSLRSIDDSARCFYVSSRQPFHRYRATDVDKRNATFAGLLFFTACSSALFCDVRAFDVFHMIPAMAMSPLCCSSFAICSRRRPFLKHFRYDIRAIYVPAYTCLPCTATRPKAAPSNAHVHVQRQQAT